MTEIVAKIVSLLENYYLAVYLIAGSALCIGLKYVGVDIFMDEAWMNLMICYFAGMIVSRASSVVVEYICKKFKLVTYSSYQDFMSAERADTTGKLLAMNSVNSLYRTMLTAALIVLFVAIIKESQSCGPCNSFSQYICSFQASMVSLLIVLLFFFSYRKQTAYIYNRVNHINNAKA